MRGMEKIVVYMLRAFALLDPAEFVQIARGLPAWCVW